MKRIIEELKSERAIFEDLKRKAQKKLEKLPKDGRIRVSKSNGVYQYYYIDSKANKNGKYIKREDINIVKDIIQRDYEKSIFDISSNNIRVIDKFIKTYKDINIRELHVQAPGRNPMITPYEKSIDERIEDWKSEVYDRKLFTEDAAYIYTNRGERVRSKSEKIIADLLDYMDIPYKYERPLELKGYGRVYPDFTIYDVANEREIIYEHFGMMDNESYSESAMRKIFLYEKNGYYTDDNLFVSFETSTNPLNSRILEKRLTKYKRA